MMTGHGRASPQRRERGSALIIALVFLLLMTILGVASMQSTVLQERMAGNQRDRNLAFQAAEAALRAGEDWVGVFANQVAVESCFNTGDCPDGEEEGAAGERLADPAGWDGSDAISDIDAAAIGLYSEDENNLGPLASAPAVHVGSPETPLLVEVDPEAGSRNIYPVTARAVGGSANAVVVLQTQFASTP
jgi:type IV pilus assembly protein PilX